MNKESILMPCLLFLIFTTGCHHRMQEQKLALVDSLIQQELYDSASHEISKMCVTDFVDESDIYHYQLLSIQTSYITSSDITNDSIVNAVVDYYKHHGPSQMYAEACYYKGVISLGNRRLAEAATWLKTAEQAGDESNNCRLKYKIKSSLSDLNRLSGNYQLQLRFALESLEIARAEVNKRWILYALYHVSISYMNLDNMQNAKQYADEMTRLIEYAQEGDLPYLYVCLGEIYKSVDKEKARDYLMKSLSYRQFSSTYEHLADLELADGNEEAAHDCWQRAITLENDSTTAKDILLHNMLQYDLAHGNIDNISQRIHDIMVMKDSVSNSLIDRTVQEIQEKFDLSVAKHEVREKQLWIAVLSMSMIILLAGTFFLIRIGKQRNELTLIRHQMAINGFLAEISRLNELNRQVNSQIAEYREWVEHFQERIHMNIHDSGLQDGLVEEINKRIDEYITKIRVLEQTCVMYEEKIANRDSALKSYVEQEMPAIIRGIQLLDVIQANEPITGYSEDYWKAFINYYKLTEQESFAKLEKSYTKLTVNNILFLILYDMGKTDSQVCRILGINPDTPRVIRFRLRKKKREHLKGEKSDDKIKAGSKN